MKKIKFIYFLSLNIFLIISVIYLNGCHNVEADPDFFRLSYRHDRGNPLDYKFGRLLGVITVVVIFG